ncbi:MAG: hypothetical protein IPK83_24710, partial [Planctomycetes bacterium]|nr:hypothetical protein [Planctomycetota bacterium]
MGAKDEGQDEAVLRIFLEHVMFQGSRNVGEDKFFLSRTSWRKRSQWIHQFRPHHYCETVPARASLGWSCGSKVIAWGICSITPTNRHFSNNVSRKMNDDNASKIILWIRRTFHLRKIFFPLAFHAPDHWFAQDLDATRIDDVRAFFAVITCRTTQRWSSL